jgi:hypothetical protein
VGQHSVDNKSADDGAETELGQADHATAGDRIGKRPTHEGHQQDRRQLREADQPDHERRTAQRVRLKGDGHVRDHAAGKGHRLADEEQSEVARLPQRRCVDRNRGDRAAQRRPARSRC